MLGCRAGEDAGEWILSHDFGERAIDGLIALGAVLHGDRTLAVEKVRDEMRRRRSSSSQPQFELVGGGARRPPRNWTNRRRGDGVGVQLPLF